MYGAWHFIHGHSGAVEDTENVSGLQRKGWGLSFFQRAGTSNWVHFAIPSNALYGWRADHLHVKFTAGDTAKVSAIHLWDGNVRIWERSVESGNGEFDMMMELGQEFEIARALGVSIKIEATESGDGLFMFHAVGANFRQV
ncbi:MAG: hypothetical protein WCT04_24075 [Planctomycetota bacterium]